MNIFYVDLKMAGMLKTIACQLQIAMTCRTSFRQHLKVHRAELEGWIGQLKTLGKGVAADLFDSWKKIDDKQTERITQTEQSLNKFCRETS